MARILVVGMMRSGKTTIADALGALRDVEVVEEPDNPLSRPFAFRVKRRLGRRYFPALRPGEAAAEYELLWRHGFGADATVSAPFSARERARGRIAGRLLRGADSDAVLRGVSGSEGPSLPWRLRAAAALAVPERPVRATPHVVVTANAPLSAEWVAERLATSVVVVVRDPVRVLSSWAELDWLGVEGHDMLDELDPSLAAAGAEELGLPLPRAGSSSALERAAWLLGLLTWHLRAAAERNPDWQVVSYERLVDRPLERLRELAERLGLPWSDHAAERLRAHAAAPAGEPEAVRTEIDPEELRRARAVLAAFPLGEWGPSGPEDAVADAAPDAAHEPAQQHDQLRHVGLRPDPHELDAPLDP